MKPIDDLAAAISREEGWWAAGDVIPRIRHNPGDLRYAGQFSASCPRCGAKDGAVPQSCHGSDGKVHDVHDIAVFPSIAAGVTGLYRDLWAKVAHGMTVRQIIEVWAPSVENNTTAYLKNVLAWTGLPADVPVLELLHPLVDPEGEPRT